MNTATTMTTAQHRAACEAALARKSVTRVPLPDGGHVTLTPTLCGQPGPMVDGSPTICTRYAYHLASEGCQFERVDDLRKAATS